ncbi:uncharacterized protein M421DRAFT_126353 [Didymella exigua CBS 183.55]|uniref:Uncharacterized protein n=1 Tax=Didymella exigua CBS 183.55 TaxID=1150837 RepID=A0A6A5RQR6_9PLEO|nr:uncharacterized protein M421DRAFT_126353 [Didymella exigua CBS 183.55]KAF1929670.1 hypothetical protein M421DRAFT_126353 [Didymella exigua CBS 183.55]
MSSVTLQDVDVVEAQQLLRRNARLLSAPRDPARMDHGVIHHHTRPDVGAPPSITSALSWQPLCCSSNVRGRGVWRRAEGVTDVFHEVQVPAIPKRNPKLMQWLLQSKRNVVKWIRVRRSTRNTALQTHRFAREPQRIKAVLTTIYAVVGLSIAWLQGGMSKDRDLREVWQSVSPTPHRMMRAFVLQTKSDKSPRVHKCGRASGLTCRRCTK